VPRVAAAPAEDLTEPAVPADTPSLDRLRWLRAVPAHREKLFIAAREQRVDALTYFSLNQSAAGGRRLEFNGDALVSDAQVAQFVDSIQVNLCAGRHIDEIGNDIIDPDKNWILCKPAQFRQGLI
jgi:hypothetical protein